VAPSPSAYVPSGQLSMHVFSCRYVLFTQLSRTYSGATATTSVSVLDNTSVAKYCTPVTKCSPSCTEMTSVPPPSNPVPTIVTRVLSCPADGTTSVIFACAKYVHPPPGSVAVPSARTTVDPVSAISTTSPILPAPPAPATATT